MKLQQAYLVLENGAAFEGQAPAWQQDNYAGEVVFSTGMTGYEESLTDPSYTGQLLTFTYPLIGNYGIPGAATWESPRIAASGALLSESCINWSHRRGEQSLFDWLRVQEVPCLVGIDTRALTKELRCSGSMLGVICKEKQKSYPFQDPNKQNLVSRVSVKEPVVSGSGSKKVILVDCGMKKNILRWLERYPLTVKQVPYDYDYSDEDYDGVFLTNGPGDPIQCQDSVRILRKAMERKQPIFGICLGSQLMGLAAGAKTYKLPFGHRGHNQPCQEVDSGRCFITSQNHGFAIDENTLPTGWTVSFRNLNDGSVEGIRHKTKPFSAVQFHPEAAPGPTDTQWLFESYVQSL